MAQLEPVLTLTIPSVHDWTVLDCRVFHPSILGDADPGADDEWKGQAAVFAHPYAPLGGSFDDGVVEAVVRELLGAGYVVATFNFRGAGNSAGKTSWTARPERGDYTSVVGFLVHYVHGLTLDPDENDNGHEASQEDCARLLHGTRHDEIWSPVLLMGGYSYGAMVTAQLPPLATMLLHFTAPAAGTAAAEVRLRAEHASREQRRRGGRRERKRSF
ncbi:hypothetical protein CDD81_8055 [Ophiocordyceps australis]|uniref:Xaa-Pro dipeptidyl-peptidase-like domain-containing protein n=1 Tax=Ophiocordyceps australis TaxID=1399860 RepID=A0A2C5Y2S6_9HYPO|nr:hypothetical protein CDD81_8055 [Ophiocordyceps australis]